MRLVTEDAADIAATGGRRRPAEASAAGEGADDSVWGIEDDEDGD